MAIRQARYQVKNNVGEYEIIHLETNANLVQETEQKQFVTLEEKDDWNSKASGVHAHDELYPSKQELEEVKQQVEENRPIVINSDSPIGSIIYKAGNSTIPNGWLACDGTSLEVNDYEELFDAIQYTYGGSDTSFNLPNIECNKIYIQGEKESEIITNEIMAIAIIKAKEVAQSNNSCDSNLDNITLTKNNNNALEIKGFADAPVGSSPIKTSNGKMEWKQIEASGGEQLPPSSGSLNVRVDQSVLFDITADQNNPYIKEIDIETTKNFDMIPVSVMRILPGVKNQISALASFSSTESSDFEENEYVEFDGSLKLKTKFDRHADKAIAFKDSSVYEIELDLDNFKNTMEVEVL